MQLDRPVPQRNTFLQHSNVWRLLSLEDSVAPDKVTVVLFVQKVLQDSVLGSGPDVCGWHLADKKGAFFARGYWRHFSGVGLMSMTSSSFYTLNHGLRFMRKYRKQNRARRNYSVHAVPPSSIIPKQEESGNPTDSNENSQSNAVTTHLDDLSGGTHSNSIGIIGGATTNNNLRFVNKLVKWSSSMNEEEDSTPFVLCSDPSLSRMLSSSHDHSTIVANLRRKRSFLENAGARCIVMPCHTSHSWYNEVAEGCSVPFLHIGDCVAKELKEAKLKPLEAGSPLRIGIIAANATLEAGFYQEKLQNQGFEVVLPDKATMEHTLIPAMEAKKRKDNEGAQNLFRIALQVLLVRAVNTVILASDDLLQDLLPPDDPLLKKCVDPMDALARSTIKFAQSAEIIP